MTPSPASSPVNVLVTYRPKKGQEEALLALVKKHWPSLSRLGLTTKEKARVWRATGKDGRTAFVEMFQWKDKDAPETAHQMPEVMAIWEPMGNHMENLEIAHVEVVDLS